jgi:hypothetical protein
MKNNIAVLLRVYPKRGPQSAVDLTEEEYDRLLSGERLYSESQ